MKIAALLSAFLLVVFNFHVSAQTLAETCTLNTGDPKLAFPPWVAYKYLKAPAPLINVRKTTPPTALPPLPAMGSQVMYLNKVTEKMSASEFTCVIEDNEWKARVIDTSVPKDLLTMEINDGTKTTRLCLLQDISLSRNGESLALRLDYGYCMDGDGKKHDQSKSFIMIGLRMVPISMRTVTPGIKSFFQGVCGAPKAPYQYGARMPISATDPERFLSLGVIQDYHKQATGKAANDDDSCFAGSVDVLHMNPVGSGPRGPTFERSTAFTMLGSQDEFGLLPITEIDYLWLVDKLPMQQVDYGQIQVYGTVEADRYCLYLGGVSCKSGCGKWCENAKSKSAPDKWTQEVKKRRLMSEEQLDAEDLETVRRMRQEMLDAPLYATSTQDVENTPIEV
jgi:hypothetical protein